MANTKFEDVTKEVMSAIGEEHNFAWYQRWLRNLKRALQCCKATREPKKDTTVDPEVCKMVVGEKYAQVCVKTITILREHHFTATETEEWLEYVATEIGKMYL